MIQRIVSGGQTGVDRAALDVARELGIPHGGWCPSGRIAEDGVLAACYALRETPTAEYAERTTWNVRDSDGTLILHGGTYNGGTSQTVDDARRLRKPLHIVDLTQPPAFEAMTAWINGHRIQALNVAGPRESKCLGIRERAAAWLRAWLSSLRTAGPQTSAQRGTLGGL